MTFTAEERRQRKVEAQARYRQKKMEEDPEAFRNKHAEYMKRYWAENPEKYQEKKRRERARKTGCTQKMYDRMLRKQKGKCAICGLPEAENRNGILHADHDHVTGKVRGLLCNHCNTALGLLDDDPDRLAAAIDYLGRI